MLLEPIVIPICCNPQETDTYNHLYGNEEELVLKNSVDRFFGFYNINLLSEYEEDEIKYTAIHSNSSVFYSRLSIREIMERIKKVRFLGTN